MHTSILRQRAVAAMIAAACLTGSALVLNPVAAASTGVVATSGDHRNFIPPSVAAHAEVGQTSYLDPGDWSPGARLSYQWISDGADIPGATGLSYLATPGDSATFIEVVVTATFPGGAAVTASAPVGFVSPYHPTAQTSPAITGAAVVGKELGVDTGTWDVPDLSYSYQWRRDGEVIVGATAPTYTVRAGDLDHAISVTVSAAKPSYAVGEATSSAVTVADHAPVNLTPPVIWAAGVGGPTYVDTGSWDIASPTYTYQWQHDGVDIPGATGTTYTPPFAWLNDEISVTVVGWAGGLASEPVTSAGRTIDKGAIESVTLPSVTGDPRPGQTLTADPGVFAVEPSELDFTWFVDGEPSGTDQTYVVKADDVGKLISVMVNASAPDWWNAFASSPYMLVLPGVPTPTTAPGITGTPLVGRRLSVTPAGWSAKDHFTRSYQWTVDGAKAATGPSFTVPASAAGKRIGVTETTGGTAYRKRSQSSATVLAHATSSVSWKVVKVKRKGRVVKGKVQVVVTVASAVPATGKVSVRLGKVTRTVAISGGRATATFTRVKRGKTKVTATYAGSTAVLGSVRSGSVRIK